MIPIDTTLETNYVALTSESNDATPPTIAIFCVGNRLMLDDGIGPCVYDELIEHYEIPDRVEVYELGCLTLDMIERVRDFDLIITVDAVDGTGEKPGTIVRFEPDAMARHSGAMASLHDLKLVDLFDAAVLLGYQAEGLCLGMQVENASPSRITMGLTPQIYQALPLLVDVVVGELARRGYFLKKLS